MRLPVNPSGRYLLCSLGLLLVSALIFTAYAVVREEVFKFFAIIVGLACLCCAVGAVVSSLRLPQRPSGRYLLFSFGFLLATPLLFNCNTLMAGKKANYEALAYAEFFKILTLLAALGSVGYVFAAVVASRRFGSLILFPYRLRNKLTPFRRLNSFTDKMLSCGIFLFPLLVLALAFTFIFACQFYWLRGARGMSLAYILLGLIFLFCFTSSFSLLTLARFKPDVFFAGVILAMFALIVLMDTNKGRGFELLLPDPLSNSDPDTAGLADLFRKHKPDVILGDDGAEDTFKVSYTASYAATLGGGTMLLDEVLHPPGAPRPEGNFATAAKTGYVDWGKTIRRKTARQRDVEVFVSWRSSNRLDQLYIVRCAASVAYVEAARASASTFQNITRGADRSITAALVPQRLFDRNLRAWLKTVRSIKDNIWAINAAALLTTVIALSFGYFAAERWHPKA